MNKSPLLAFILLDRSGSMENCRDTTIDAFNEYVMGLRRSDEVDARVALMIFDSQSIDMLQQPQPAKTSLELNRATYVPRASTPLLDAIGQAVAEIDKTTLRPNEKVGLVILTDGFENASKEHTKETIRKLLADRQDNKGWLVTFLGADVDAFNEAGAIGIKSQKYLQLKKTKLAHAMRYAAASQARYATTGNLDEGDFSNAERDDADKD
ncbi:MAG: VWA domain-containing protein [Proteobacteria bacterium]|nr:VWA domain-containing protein [Pseudomonadota bacterium]